MSEQEETAEEYAIHSFALTEEDGARVFGSALVFYVSNESMDEEVVSPSATKTKWVIPRAICLTSHWAFFEIMERFLHMLYEASKIKPQKVPLERMLTNLIHETPLPPRGRMRVHLSLMRTEFVFERPPPNELPLFNFHFARLFQLLSIDNVCLVFSSMLIEKRYSFFQPI